MANESNNQAEQQQQISPEQLANIRRNASNRGVGILVEMLGQLDGQLEQASTVLRVMSAKQQQTEKDGEALQQSLVDTMQSTILVQKAEVEKLRDAKTTLEAQIAELRALGAKLTSDVAPFVKDIQAGIVLKGVIDQLCEVRN